MSDIRQFPNQPAASPRTNRLGRTAPPGGNDDDTEQDFRYLTLNGMRVDRSWARPGQDYLNIYDYVRHK